MLLQIQRGLGHEHAGLAVVGDAERGAARAVRQRRLGHGHRLAREHALVHDHVAVEQDAVALHDGHVLDDEEVARHQVLTRDVFLVD